MNLLNNPLSRKDSQTRNPNKRKRTSDQVGQLSPEREEIQIPKKFSKSYHTEKHRNRLSQKVIFRFIINVSQNQA